MKSMKKWLIALMVALAVVCAYAGVLAEEKLPESPVTDFRYSIADGAVTITEYEGNDAVVVVPATIEGLPVTVIGEAVFEENTQLNTIHLPTTVHTIEAFAFARCSNLEAVYGAENVLSYGDMAFLECFKLASISVNNDPILLGNACFAECPLLDMMLCVSADCLRWESPISGTPSTVFAFSTSEGEATVAKIYTEKDTVYIPDTYKGLPVTVIGEASFEENTQLNTIHLPTTVHTIEIFAFARCSNLEAVYGAENVLSYGDMAFLECFKLTSISVNNDPILLGYACFAECPLLDITLCVSADCLDWESPISGTRSTVFAFSISEGEATVAKIYNEKDTVYIPDTYKGLPVTAIGTAACYENDHLKTLHLPDTIHTIGYAAFAGCTQLCSVDLGDSVQTIVDHAFASCPNLIGPLNLEGINVSEFAFSHSYGVLYGGIPGTYDDFSYCIVGNEVIIAAYNGSDAVVTIPETINGVVVTKIGDTSFDRIETLQAIDLGDTVRSIGKDAFVSCSNLQSVTFGNSVQSIGEYAFYNCDSLQSVAFSDSVQTIGEGAFSCCDNLQYVTFGASMQRIDYYAFAWCPRLIGPLDLEGISVDDYAFHCSYGAIYGGVPGFYGDWSFCATDDEMIITEYIGNDVDVIVPSDINGLPVTKIVELCFVDKLISSIVIPDTVTEIGEYLFLDCTELTDVKLSNNLEGIPTCTFYGCTSLKSLVLPDSVEYIDLVAFAGCTSLESINWPANLKSLAACAFDNTGILEQSVARIMDEVITPGMSDFEKAFALHDWIIYHAEYQDNSSIFSPIGVLYFGKGVCQSYADAYSLLLNEVGINNEFVTSEKMKHIWNLIELDGEWYHVDCTWDDPVGGGQEQHRYFGLNDKLMRKDHTWDDPDLLPEANGTRYTYGGDNTICPMHEETVVPAVAPTCTEPGLTEGTCCSKCGMMIIHQETIPALGHLEKPSSTIKPTCTETGLTGGSFCYRCGEPVAPHVTIPATGHKVIATSTDLVMTEGDSLTLADFADTCEHANDFILTGTSTNNDVLAIVDNKLCALDTGCATMQLDIRMPDGFGTEVTITALIHAQKTMTLPAALTEIGEEAFANSAAEEFILQDGITAIGPRAFADSNARFITIPVSVLAIAEDAFAGCDVTIITPAGSEAESFALEHEIPCLEYIEP